MAGVFGLIALPRPAGLPDLTLALSSCLGTPTVGALTDGDKAWG